MKYVGKTCHLRTGSCWTSWGAPEAHTHGLRQCDETAISQWSYHKSLLASQVLVAVFVLDVANLNHASTYTMNVVRVRLPRKAGLLEPLEVVRIGKFLLAVALHQVSEDISLVHLNSNQCLHLTTHTKYKYNNGL